MTTDACFELGRILKPHGLKGELLSTVVTEDIDHLKKLKMVFLEINTRLVPFFIKNLTFIGKTKVILQFEDLHVESEALSLSNIKIYVPLTELPGLGKDQFYYHEVKGYDVEDGQHGLLGKIEEIYEMPGQDLIAVIYHGQEVLIPISNEIVLKADHQAQIVYVDLPNGLLDLYLKPDTEEPNED